jgi:hypothetical protein
MSAPFDCSIIELSASHNRRDLDIESWIQEAGSALLAGYGSRVQAPVKAERSEFITEP